MFPPHGPVVQLVRTLACHARGRRFEPVPGRHFPFAFVAQLVEQRTENPRVVGSIPTEGTICGCSSSGRAPPCQGGGSGFESRHPLQNKRTLFWCPFCFTMGWARKGRFAVGEFKQSCELLKDRGRVGKRERSRASPVIRSKIKGHRFGVLFVLQWGGLEKAGSPQANSNNPVNYLKGRGRVYFVLFLHSS